MNVSSMTGFSRTETEKDNYEIVCELKSVNNRFKDYRFRMPNFMNSIELELKKIAEKHIKRGSLDIYLQAKKKSKEEVFNIDFDKVNTYLKQFKENISTDVSIQPAHFLRTEFSKEVDKSSQESLLVFLKETFTETIKSLQTSRLSEGKELKVVLEKNLESLKKTLLKVHSIRNENKENVEKKLLEKFKEKNVELELDDSRLYKEVIFYLEKLDIDEEIDRANIHLEKLSKLLNDESVVKGREIEFTLQELNREVNTIGSKANHEEISQAVVKCKMYLEKMREQALNIQ